MTLKKLKKYFLSKRFQKELMKAPEIRVSNSKEIHSVAILTDQKNYNEIDLVGQVEQNFKSIRKVQIYCFRDFKKDEEKSYKHFSEKDLDLRGNIKEQSLYSFLDDSFDLLIGYFDENNLYLEYAALKSKATFKIGLAKVNDKIYDLVVAEQVKNAQVFINEIKKYLKLLNKIQ